MSPNDQRNDQASPPDARLRLDAGKIAAARQWLGEIDGAVFAIGRKHAADAHNDLIGRVVTGLFARG